jgi:hypothetical protein
MLLEKVSYFESDYDDLNTFIAEMYNLDEFQGTLDSDNDSKHNYNVELGEVDQEDLSKILENKGCEYWSLEIVLTDMCNKGWIPAGNHLVNVCW